METDIIYNKSCLNMEEVENNSIDLTVTSPPYDNLRTYNGYVFDFEPIAQELYRVTKSGGVVVWVVGDATIKGSETGTSFKQALYFKEIGFNLHDTMIYMKDSVSFPASNRYNNIFEYMFVLCKSKSKTFNPLMRDNLQNARLLKCTDRQKNGETKLSKVIKIKPKSIYGNIWCYKTGYMKSTKEKIAFEHPAIFPEQLASDHIISWSNEGDIILDPMFGSGTTLKMAKKNNRRYIGFEINKEYYKIAKARLEAEKTLWD